MSEITNEMRIAASQFVVSILNAVRSRIAGQTSTKDMELIKYYLPKFKVRITFNILGSTKNVSTRYFTFMDRNHKGKKRVYVSTEAGKNDLYMFYVQKERLTKLCRGEKHIDWAINLLGNKWVVANGIHEYKNVFQLMSHIIAIENAPSRSNKPVIDDKVVNWVGADKLARCTTDYRSSFVEYNVDTVEVEAFSFDKECAGLIK